MTILRQRMIEDMQVRNLSPSTRDTYLLQVSLFPRHFRKSPAMLGPKSSAATRCKMIKAVRELNPDRGCGTSVPLQDNSEEAMVLRRGSAGSEDAGHAAEGSQPG